MGDIDNKKKAHSLDEAIEIKMNEFVNIINKEFEKVYENFNMVLAGRDKEDARVNAAYQTQNSILWGMLQENRIRLITLENFLIEKGYINQEADSIRLDEMYTENLAKYKEATGMHEVPIGDTNQMQTGLSALDSANEIASDPDIDKPF